MSDRDMTGEERQDFEANVVHQDDSAESTSTVEPAGPRRRTRPRSSGGRKRADDFNPTSRGDERGEVM
jgi:hypothetical protein